MMKGLFRNGSRHTVARSRAGQAQASTAIAEIGSGAPRSFGASVFTLVSLSFVILFCVRKQ